MSESTRTHASADYDRRNEHVDPQPYGGRGLPCLLECLECRNWSELAPLRGHGLTSENVPERTSTTSSFDCSIETTNANNSRVNRADRVSYLYRQVEEGDSKGSATKKVGRCVTSRPSTASSISSSVTESGCFTSLLSRRVERRSADDSDQCKQRSTRRTDGIDQETSSHRKETAA
jgi:hypothetical protein